MSMNANNGHGFCLEMQGHLRGWCVKCSFLRYIK